MVYTTKQQQAVLHCLEQRPDEALTATDLAADLREAGHPVGLATIYRQLEKLEAAGRIHRIHTEDGALFQYCPHSEESHPCFLLRCESCGRISHLDCDHLEELTHHLLHIDGVEEVHHIHVWSMDGHNNFATLHELTGGDGHRVKDAIREE